MASASHPDETDHTMTLRLVSLARPALAAAGLALALGLTPAFAQQPASDKVVATVACYTGLPSTLGVGHASGGAGL